LIHAVVEGRLAEPGPAARRMAEHVVRWREGHVSLVAAPSELVLSVSGRRR
jgi:hypothetical protein